MMVQVDDQGSGLTTRVKDEIKEAEKRFQKAKTQVFFLTTKLADLKKRYRTCEQWNLETFRDSYRMKIMVVKGLLFMYEHYACVKGTELLSLYRSTIDGDRHNRETN